MKTALFIRFTDCYRINPTLDYVRMVQTYQPSKMVGYFSYVAPQTAKFIAMLRAIGFKIHAPKEQRFKTQWEIKMALDALECDVERYIFVGRISTEFVPLFEKLKKNGAEIVFITDKLAQYLYKFGRAFDINSFDFSAGYNYEATEGQKESVHGDSVSDGVE